MKKFLKILNKFCKFINEFYVNFPKYFHQFFSKTKFSRLFLLLILPKLLKLFCFKSNFQTFYILIYFILYSLLI